MVGKTSNKQKRNEIFNIQSVNGFLIPFSLMTRFCFVVSHNSSAAVVAAALVSNEEKKFSKMMILDSCYWIYIP